MIDNSIKAENENPKLPENLVLYDGDCGFCNSTVQFIVSKNKCDFHFIALQNGRSEKLLSKHNKAVNYDTIYLLKGNKIFDRSSAILQISRGLKGGYPLLFAFYIVPKILRDSIYNFLAKRRNKIIIKHCLILNPDERKFFL